MDEKLFMKKLIQTVQNKFVCMVRTLHQYVRKVKILTGNTGVCSVTECEGVCDR